MITKCTVKITALICVFFLITGCSVDKESVLEKFIGSYSVSETCTVGGDTSYKMEILKKNENFNEVYIKNFGGYGSIITGVVSGSTVIIDAYSDNLHIESIGTISSNRSQIVFPYKVTNNTGTYTCSATALK